MASAKNAVGKRALLLRINLYFHCASERGGGKGAIAEQHELLRFSNLYSKPELWARQGALHSQKEKGTLGRYFWKKHCFGLMNASSK